jgi:hypothetical protein
MSDCPRRALHSDLRLLAPGRILDYLLALDQRTAGFHYEAMWRLVFVSGVMGQKYRCLALTGEERTMSDILAEPICTGNKEGVADYRLQINTDPVLRGSSKFYGNDAQYAMEDYDLDKLNREANGSGHMFLCVRNKGEVLRKLKRCQEPKFRDWLSRSDGSYRVYGLVDLLRHWRLLVELVPEQWLSAKTPLQLLPHQEWTVRRTVELFANGEKEVLFHHLMRMGKTYMAAGVVDRLRPSRVLIITPQPTETYEQYGKETFLRYSNFTDYRIIVADKGLRAYNIKELNAGQTILITSKQALDAYSNLLGFSKFDLLFSDENDFAGTTNRLWRNMQKLKSATSRTVFMTYTANKSIVYHGISPSARLGFELWDIADMAQLEDAEGPEKVAALDRLEVKFPGLVAIARETQEHPAAWYRQQPTPYFMTVRGLAERTAELLARYRETDYGYNLNTAFTLVPNASEFQCPQVIRAIIATLVGHDGTDNYQPQLVPNKKGCFERMHDAAGGIATRRWFHVIFIPYTKGESFTSRAKVFQRYLEEHRRLAGYRVHIVSGGMKCDQGLTLKDQVAKWYAESTHGIIVLACNMLRRAVSLPKLDSIVLLDSTLSADKYIQTIFRPMTSDSGKRHGFIVDFQEGHILRALSVVLRDELACAGTDEENQRKQLRRVAKCIFLDGLRGEQMPLEQLQGILQQYRDFTAKQKYAILHPKISLDLSAAPEEALNLLEIFQGIRQQQVRTPTLGELHLDPDGEDVAELPSGLLAEAEDKPLRVRCPRTIKMLRSLDQELVPLIQLAVLVCPTRSTTDLESLLSQIESDPDAAFLFQEIVGLRAPRLQTAEQHQRLSPFTRSPTPDSIAAAPPSPPAVAILLEAVRASNLSQQPSVMALVAETQAQLLASLEDPEAYYTFFTTTLGNPAGMEVAAYGEVYTPLTLVRQMLDRLPTELWDNPMLRWFEPACGLAPFVFEIYQRLMKRLASVAGYQDEEVRRRHILENMLYLNEIQAKNLALIKILFRAGSYRLNIFEGNALHAGVVPPKFRADIVVGNPPYNAPGKGRNVVWDDFVRQALCAPWLAPNGYLLFVHPPIWRQPPAEKSCTKNIYKLLAHERQLLYLTIHDAKAGKATFGCDTRYDWYLLHNRLPTTATTVRSEDGTEAEVDLRLVTWLPNRDVQRIAALLAPPGSEGARVSFGYKYDTHKETGTSQYVKKYLADERSETFCYPLVHTTPKSGPRILYTSLRDEEFFAPNKVIFSDSSIGSTVIDMDGTYGTTQHAIALLGMTDLADAEKCASVISSPAFLDVLKACCWSGFQIKWSLFPLLKEGFWRDFQYELGEVTSPTAAGPSELVTLDAARLQASIGRDKKGYSKEQLLEFCKERRLNVKKSDTKAVLVAKLRL